MAPLTGIIIGLLLAMNEQTSGAFNEDQLFHQNMKEAGECLRARDYVAAMPRLKAALAQQPYSVLAHDALGVTYSQLGQYESAIQHFKTALQIDPRQALTHNNLGYLYLKLLRWPEALAEFQQALEIDPENDTVQVNLARVFIATARFEEAGHLLHATLRRHPNHSEASGLLTDLGRLAPPPATRPQAPQDDPPNRRFKIIASDPTKILRAPQGLSYHLIDPTTTLLLELVPNEPRPLRFEFWSIAPEMKGRLYWTFMPDQPGVKGASLSVVTPKTFQTVSDHRLVSAGSLELIMPRETRQFFLSASQPVYVTIQTLPSP